MNNLHPVMNDVRKTVISNPGNIINALKHIDISATDGIMRKGDGKMEKCWNDDCGLYDTDEMGNCNNPFLADIDTCHNFKAKTDTKVSGQIAAMGYKAHLVALCEGLEIKEIDDLLTKEPEYFRELGVMMANIFK